LQQDALETDRWNMLHPDKKPKSSFLANTLKNAEGVFVAASDYVKALPESVARWLPGPLFSLGTDGFGRSDGRRHLRNFFEVDERYIVLASLHMLMKEGKIKPETVAQAIKKFDIDPEKANPVVS